MCVYVRVWRCGGGGDEQKESELVLTNVVFILSKCELFLH